MDGFVGKEGVIVIAASNRPDVLDPALLHFEGFDRQVVVKLADIPGPEQILRVHMRKIPSAKDIDLSIFEPGTPGFSGSDCAYLFIELLFLQLGSNNF